LRPVLQGIIIFIDIAQRLRHSYGFFVAGERAFAHLNPDRAHSTRRGRVRNRNAPPSSRRSFGSPSVLPFSAAAAALLRSACSACSSAFAWRGANIDRQQTTRGEETEKAHLPAAVSCLRCECFCCRCGPPDRVKRAVDASLPLLPSPDPDCCSLLLRRRPRLLPLGPHSPRISSKPPKADAGEGEKQNPRKVCCQAPRRVCPPLRRDKSLGFAVTPTNGRVWARITFCARSIGLLRSLGGRRKQSVPCKSGARRYCQAITWRYYCAERRKADRLAYDEAHINGDYDERARRNGPRFARLSSRPIFRFAVAHNGDCLSRGKNERDFRSASTHALASCVNTRGQVATQRHHSARIGGDLARHLSSDCASRKCKSADLPPRSRREFPGVGARRCSTFTCALDAFQDSSRFPPGVCQIAIGSSSVSGCDAAAGGE
jgi:hypothetical protein